MQNDVIIIAAFSSSHWYYIDKWAQFLVRLFIFLIIKLYNLDKRELYHLGSISRINIRIISKTIYPRDTSNQSKMCWNTLTNTERMEVFLKLNQINPNQSYFIMDLFLKTNFLYREREEKERGRGRERNEREREERREGRGREGTINEYMFLKKLLKCTLN